MRRRTGRPAAPAFTLVELVTAVALVSIMMLGVVEIFTMITDTAAEAEAAANAQQQMRGLFDQLHRDLRGLTRDGYLRIESNWSIPVETQVGGRDVWQMCDPVPATDPTVADKTRAYAVNTLAFTSLGQWEGTFNPQQARSAAAEVLYTNYTKTPGQYLTLGTRTTREDPRRGVLGRAAWIMDGTAGAGNEWVDQSKAAFLGQLVVDGLAYPGTHTVVDPWVAGLAFPSSPETLRRVMVTCASEFYVEYWEETWASNRWDGQWRNRPEGGAAALWTYESPVWPKALRITAVVHDPGDIGPAELDSSGNPKRHRGYALQEVFWLGDP
jgi:type II secretory pathway pseudopilin PulG